MRKRLCAIALVGFAGLLSACGSASVAQSSPSPAASASPSSAASPVPSATAPAGFVTTPVSGGAVAQTTVTTVRVGQHDGYDRFVIEFVGGVPSYTITPVGSAVFTRSPKGDQVTLEGTGGVLIVIHIVTNWLTYTGPTEFRPGYPYLRQALQVENFEGYQQWALGIQGKACIRVTTLGSPDRLVVDVIGL